jgi:hypothetical protein
VATKETTSSATPKELGQTKRPTTQMGGARKNIKEHKTHPEYMITEDDANMVAQVVQDLIFEDFENAACQRDIIEEDLAYMQQLLR